MERPLQLFLQDKHRNAVSPPNKKSTFFRLPVAKPTLYLIITFYACLQYKALRLEADNAGASRDLSNNI
jgi:hypothetical protein